MAAYGWQTRPRTSKPSACCTVTGTRTSVWSKSAWAPCTTTTATLTYNINGIPIPYPVDQAITIQSVQRGELLRELHHQESSWMRGSKLGLAVNNLADSHNIVGITPFTAATAAAPYVPNGGDQLNLLPGRSVMATFTVGWAPRR